MSGDSSSCCGGDAGRPASQPRTTTTDAGASNLGNGGGRDDGSDGEREGRRLATPEEVRETVETARSVFRDDRAVPVKVKAAARQHGLSRVRTALEWASRRDAKSWGYVLTALKSWTVEGVVPVPSGPSPKASSDMTREELAAAMGERRRQMQAERDAVLAKLRERGVAV